MMIIIIIIFVTIAIIIFLMIIFLIINTISSIIKLLILMCVLVLPLNPKVPIRFSSAAVGTKMQKCKMQKLKKKMQMFLD